MKVIQISSEKAINNLSKEMLPDFGLPYWGTEEMYVKFNDYLSKSPWETETGKYWVLLEDSNNEKDVEENSEIFLAACETYSRNAILKVDDEEISGNCYGITLVFVGEKKRKRGYASILLEKVMNEIQKNDSKCLGFYLHSVVGAHVYEKVGFQTISTFEWYFPPKQRNIENPNIVHLSQQDVRNQWKSVQENISREQPEFFIQSSVEELDWHFMMEFGNEEKYKERGILLGKSEIFFRIDPFSHSLSSMHSQFHSEEEAKELIEEFQHIAANVGVEDALVIEDNKKVNWKLLEKLGGQRRPRKKYLTMLKPVHPKLKREMWQQSGLSDWL